MAEQYWIGDFFIDLSRNQIIKNTQIQVIAPKALAVLTYLAENQGKVVSHDALLAKVWQNTVVSTNTLQRSIAQLRKALGDDGKVQVYIKTHAKQGYSLECEVRWNDNIEASNPNILNETVADNPQINEVNSEVKSEVNSEINTDINTVAQPKSSKSGFMPIYIIISIIIMGVIGYLSLADKQPSLLSFGEFRALTSTDDREFASIYSPDGQFVVFHRYSEEFCINNIWAKNTQTQKEYQLTKNLDSYGSHSFSEDGKQLVFIQAGDCSKPITQKKCYKLMSLNFNKALESPQTPSVLMECKNSKILKPTWLNNNNIALLQKSSERWQLISYSTNDNTSKVLYSLDEGNIITYDYSVKDDLIALTSIHVDGNYYIELLKADGEVISSHRIQYPKEIANFRLFNPKFSPIKDQLIFSTGRQLFTLSYDGQVTNISLPLDESMGTPTFHPDGKRMLVIKGHFDSDIASIPLSEIKVSPTETTQSNALKNYSVLERSILAEKNALFQPNGELLAYESERSGEEQLWITDGKGSQQLTNFPMDTYIYGMNWAADGNSLLVNANDALIQVYLDSTLKKFPLDYSVYQLLQWDSENNSALLILRIKGILKFVELNLTNSEIRIINDKQINWALKTKNDQLIYTDHMNRFWQSGPVEDQHIEALDSQIGEKQRFIIKNNVIYSVNDDSQLWSYDLNKQLFTIIGDLPKNLFYLSDINQTHLLMAIRISSNKEVVELSLRE